jgi:hypothetical protein
VVKLEEKFKSQAHVNVFYKEGKPALSVLEPGYNTKLKYVFAASLTFNLIILLGLLYSL